MTNNTHEALGHIKMMAEFAYQNGFHELGYDPIEIIEKVIDEFPYELKGFIQNLANAEFSPDLTPVIDWLEKGCDPKEAAKELRIYRDMANSAANPTCKYPLCQREPEQNRISNEIHKRLYAGSGISDDQIIDCIDRSGFAWQNLGVEDQCNLLGSIHELFYGLSTPDDENSDIIDYPSDEK